MFLGGENQDGRVDDVEPLDTEDEEGEGKKGEEEEEGEESEPSTANDEDKFLDPNNLPSELLPAFKRMQASFTRAMQGVKGVRQKADMYDKFLQNPEGTIAELAEKHGLKVTKQGKVTEDAAETKEMTDTEKWVRSIIKNVINEELNPQLDKFRSDGVALKVKQYESYMDDNHPDWRLYDDILANLLSKYPEMYEDPDRLYKLAKLEAAEATPQTRKTVSTKPSKGRNYQVETKPKARTVDEAFDQALKDLEAKKGR